MSDMPGEIETTETDTDKVIRALRKVPAKSLLLIELANRIPIKNGEFDIDELTKHQPEVNLAIAEAKMYGAQTIVAVESLIRLKGRGES
jgi:hypothetical protein